MICESACAQDVPQHPSAGCGVTPRAGGIAYLIFKKCDVEFVDITDTGEWETKIAAHEVHATGMLLANKPQGSFNRKKLSSCFPEQVVSGQKQIDFSDYNSDDTNFEDYTFWNTLINNQTLYHFGWLTCDGLFYGFHEHFTLEVDDNIEEDVNDNTFFAGSVFYDQLAMSVPQSIAGLESVLD